MSSQHSYDSIITDIVQHIQTISSATQNEITAKSALIAEGILDSLAVISLITYLEEKYNINFEEGDMLSDDMTTPDGLSRMISSKLVN